MSRAVNQNPVHCLARLRESVGWAVRQVYGPRFPVATYVRLVLAACAVIGLAGAAFVLLFDRPFERITITAAQFDLVMAPSGGGPITIPMDARTQPENQEIARALELWPGCDRLRVSIGQKAGSTLAVSASTTHEGKEVDCPPGTARVTASRNPLSLDAQRLPSTPIGSLHRPLVVPVVSGQLFTELALKRVVVPVVHSSEARSAAGASLVGIAGGALEIAATAWKLQEMKAVKVDGEPMLRGTFGAPHVLTTFTPGLAKWALGEWWASFSKLLGAGLLFEALKLFAWMRRRRALALAGAGRRPAAGTPAAEAP